MSKGIFLSTNINKRRGTKKYDENASNSFTLYLHSNLTKNASDNFVNIFVNIFFMMSGFCKENIQQFNAGMHNIRPAGQMWPAEALHLARQP